MYSVFGCTARSILLTLALTLWHFILTVVCAEFPIIFPTISRKEELNLAHDTSPTLLSGTLLRVGIPSFNGQEMGMKEWREGRSNESCND